LSASIFEFGVSVKLLSRLLNLCRFHAKKLLGVGGEPDFIIVGVQKGGTTSLYNYMIQHPLISSARRKEVHFFDSNYYKGMDWYKAHFCCDASKVNEGITGEASPYYIFHPYALDRIKAAFPDMKIIVMLRDPVDRCYSQYRHNVRRGRETRKISEALDADLEAKVLVEELRAFSNNIHYASERHQHFSYLARGLYYTQLKHCQDIYGDNLLILKSEDLFSSPESVLSQVYSFLEVPFHGLKDYRVHGKGVKMQDIDSEMTKSLVDYYRDEMLMLKREFGIGFDRF